jgi:hypothetical protein
MVNNLIRSGFWKRVPGGFQVAALAKIGTRTPREIEAERQRLNAELANLPELQREKERNFRLANYIYGIGC